MGPQGELTPLSPLLYSPFPRDCVAAHSSNTIIKFADAHTTVIGLITDEDEGAYREEVNRLQNQAADCGLQKASKFLGVRINEDLSWTPPHQRPHKDAKTAALFPRQG